MRGASSSSHQRCKMHSDLQEVLLVWKVTKQLSNSRLNPHSEALLHESSASVRTQLRDFESGSHRRAHILILADQRDIIYHHAVLHLI